MTNQRYKLIGVKATRVVEGTLADAVKAAEEMDESLQGAFGVTIEDENGVTVAEVGGAL